MNTQSLSCVQLCEPMECSPPGSSAYGIFQARILDWVAISSSRIKNLNIMCQLYALIHFIKKQQFHSHPSLSQCHGFNVHNKYIQMCMYKSSNILVSHNSRIKIKIAFCIYHSASYSSSCLFLQDLNSFRISHYFLFSVKVFY